jgi:hypothetical protein
VQQQLQKERETTPSKGGGALERAQPALLTPLRERTSERSGILNYKLTLRYINERQRQEQRNKAKQSEIEKKSKFECVIDIDDGD